MVEPANTQPKRGIHKRNHYSQRLKKEYRRWYKSHRSTPPVEQCKAWLKKKSELDIPACTFAKWITSQYDFLDDTNNSALLKSSRRRNEAFPKFESALRSFVDCVDLHGIIVTNEIIKLAAEELFAEIYPDKEHSTFSNCWLTNFKNRQDLSYQYICEKATEVPPTSEANIAVLRKAFAGAGDTRDCDPKIDETDFHFTPCFESTDSSEESPTIWKCEQEGKIVAFVANADGSDEFPFSLTDDEEQDIEGGFDKIHKKVFRNAYKYALSVAQMNKPSK